MLQQTSARLQGTERRLFTHYRLAVSQRYLKLAEPALRLRILEAGAGPPVLLLHAVGSLATHWLPLLPHLEPFRSVAVDLPGHGFSEGFNYRGVHLRTHAVAVLCSFLDALELPQAAIVANSLGGLFALWLALDAPERVSRLAVVGAPGTALAGTKAGLGLATMATPGINRLLLRAPLPLAATRFALGQAVGSNALKQVPPELVETTHLATKLPGYAGSVSTLLERLLRFRTPRPENVLTDDELRRLSQPILFVWGKNDAILTPEIGHRSIAKMPNAILTVMPGGHEPWLDDAVRCGGLVSSFLRQPQKCSVT